MRIDESEIRQLTNWKGWDSMPIWSPDGSKILFTSDRDATAAEMEINQHGTAGERGLAVFVLKSNGQDERATFDDGAMQDVPTSWGG